MNLYIFGVESEGESDVLLETGSSTLSEESLSENDVQLSSSSSHIGLPQPKTLQQEFSLINMNIRNVSFEKVCVLQMYNLFLWYEVWSLKINSCLCVVMTFTFARLWQDGESVYTYYFCFQLVVYSNYKTFYNLNKIKVFFAYRIKFYDSGIHTNFIFNIF